MVIVHVPGNDNVVQFDGTDTVSIEDGCLVIYSSPDADCALGGFAPGYWQAFDMVSDAHG